MTKQEMLKILKERFEKVDSDGDFLFDGPTITALSQAAIAIIMLEDQINDEEETKNYKPRPRGTGPKKF